MVRPFSRARAQSLSRSARLSLIESLEPRVLLSAAWGPAGFRLNTANTGWFVDASRQPTKPKNIPATTPSTTVTGPTAPTLALAAAVAPIITFGNNVFASDGNYHPAKAVAYASNGTTPISGSFAFTYNGSATPPVAPGNYAVAATFTSNDVNYTNATAYTVLTVGPGGIVPAVGAATHVTFANNVFTYHVDSGSVSFTADLAAMAPFSLNIAAGASATVSSRQTLNSLTLGANATLTIANTNAPKPIVVKSLSIAAGAKLDLANNDLIVDYTGQANPASALRTLLATGYNGGTWNGLGITSSHAQAASGSMSLNLFDNAAAATPFTEFDGVPVGTQTAFIKYTYAADLHVNGTVDSNDAITLANNYAEGAAATRQRGDLNYNGIYDSNDAILFANAYSESLPAMPIAVPNAPDQLSLLTTSDTTINLSWRDNSATETGVLVQRSTDGTNFTTVATLAPNTTAWQDTARTPDTKYHYRVLAANASGNSPATPAQFRLTLPTFTRTIWVDASYAGTTKNGAFATPYTTITSALSSIVTNSTGNGIVVRGGLYSEKLTMKNYTTLMSLPGEVATVSGFTKLSALAVGGSTWTSVGGGMYEMTVNTNIDTLYVDSTPQDIARSPNSGWWKPTSVSHDTTAGTTTVTDPTHLANIPSLVGGYFYAHVASGNTYGGRTITAHNTATGSITFATLTNFAATDSNYYMIKNKDALLDRPGEWTVKAGATAGQYVVRFWPKDVADLAKTQARTATTQQIIASGTHDIVIRGLEVMGNKGYGIYASGNAYNITVRDNIVHHNASTGIMFRYANNVAAINNYSAANGTGISVSSVNVGLIEGNEVALNTIDGIIVAGDIHGQPPTDPTFVKTYDVTVKNNYSHHNLGYSHSDGIQMYRWAYRTKFITNLVANNGQGLMTEEVDTTELSGNVFWNTAAYTVIGKSNTTTMNIHNNTIGGSGYGPYNLSSSPGVTANENITIGTTGNGSTAAGYYNGNRNFFYQPVAGGNIVSANSKFYKDLALYKSDTGKDPNSLTGDPQFLNAPVVSTMCIGDKTRNTATKLYVNSVSGFAVGDHIEINGDGVVRTITAITTGTNNNTITFDLPLPSPPMTEYVCINNWKTKTDYTLDLRVNPASAAATLSATGGPVGATLNIQQYMANDFNADGYRDIPLPSMAVIAGLPDPVNWSPPTY